MLAVSDVLVTASSKQSPGDSLAPTNPFQISSACVSAAAAGCCRWLQVSSIQQERQGTEGLVADLGKQSAALEAWLAAHEWKADAVAAALAKGSSEAGALDINKVIVPAGGRGGVQGYTHRRAAAAVAAAAGGGQHGGSEVRRAGSSELIPCVVWRASLTSAARSPANLQTCVRLCWHGVSCPADDLSRQALMAQAEDLAVEDCLLVLEKALLQGKVTPEAYMKQVGGGGWVGCCWWKRKRAWVWSDSRVQMLRSLRFAAWQVTAAVGMGVRLGAAGLGGQAYMHVVLAACASCPP